MTRDEYNANVQEMQAMFADTRIKPYTSDGSNRHYPAGQIYRADFDVYWDGRWWNVGSEHMPMTPEVRRTWYEDVAMRLKAQFADALVRS